MSDQSRKMARAVTELMLFRLNKIALSELLPSHMLKASDTPNHTETSLRGINVRSKVASKSTCVDADNLEVSRPIVEVLEFQRLSCSTSLSLPSQLGNTSGLIQC
jgi:hypothetical protein